MWLLKDQVSLIIRRLPLRMHEDPGSRDERYKLICLTENIR